MATIYIDPSRPTNGAGTLEDPKNTWVGLTWTAGNSYLQKRGTTFTTDVGSAGRIAPSVSGTRLARIVLGSYGEGPNAKIVSFADTAINLSRRSYITVEDLIIDTTYSSASAIGGNGDTGAASVGILVQNNTIYGGAPVAGPGDGISFVSMADSLPIKELVIRNNTLYNIGGHGILCAGSHEATRVENNVVTRSGIVLARHGISSYPHRATITPTWTLVSGNVYSTPIGAQTYATTVSEIYGVRYITTNITLARAATATAPNLNEFGYSGGLLYVNLGFAPSGTLTFSYTKLSVIFCDNTVQNVVDMDGQEGHGIQLDDLTDNSFIQRNFIANCEGAGIQVNMGRNNVIEGNIIVNVKKAGINLGVNGAVLNKAYNNTIIFGKDTLLTVNGIGLAANNEAKNNIISNYITGIQGTGTSTEDYNNVFGATTVRTGGISTGANTTSVDPKLTSVYTLQSSSPLVDAGEHLKYTLDYSKTTRPNPPSIGAYEFVEERAVR